MLANFLDSLNTKKIMKWYSSVSIKIMFVMVMKPGTLGDFGYLRDKLYSLDSMCEAVGWANLWR